MPLKVTAAITTDSRIDKVKKRLPAAKGERFFILVMLSNYYFFYILFRDWILTTKDTKFMKGFSILKLSFFVFFVIFVVS